LLPFAARPVVVDRALVRVGSISKQGPRLLAARLANRTKATTPAGCPREHQIGVDPGVRRRGIGRALLEAVELKAPELGVQQVALDTWSFNASAQAFFLEPGFGCG
jgi:GNAT superfamily N-acetyltransferase